MFLPFPSLSLIVVVIPVFTMNAEHVQSTRHIQTPATIYSEMDLSSPANTFYIDSTQTKFEIEAQKLLDETLYTSSISAIAQHPAFQSILTMGAPALAFILRRMQAGEIRTPWFPLLKQISGEDPVPVENRGRVRKMAHGWVMWGKTNGYLS